MPIDVAIVGAGPAGARAAYELARRGARVTVFDGSRPREKPCGGGVTGRALALVRDQIDTRHLPHTVIRSVRFMQGSGAPLRRFTPASSVGVPLDANALVVASRASFDEALLAAAEAAGAAFVRLRVTDISVGTTGISLTTADGGRHHAARLEIHERRPERAAHQPRPHAPRSGDSRPLGRSDYARQCPGLHLVGR